MHPLLALMVFDAFRQSDIVGKAIVFGLAGISLYVLGVIVNKFVSLRGFKSYNQIFLAAYKNHPHPTYLALDPRGLVSASPVSAVYIAGVHELLRRLHTHGVADDRLRAWAAGDLLPVLDETEIESIRSACERSLSQQQLVLEAQMSRISTAISVAPSIGLFGTVWGVMGAFMSMSTGGASMISAVAPGISGALLTTVAGLAVAIPSIVCYNILAGIIRRHVVVLENFEDQFLTEIARLHTAQEQPRVPPPAAPVFPAPPQSEFRFDAPAPGGTP